MYTIVDLCSPACMNRPTKQPFAPVLVALIAVLALIGGCSDDPVDEPLPPADGPRELATPTALADSTLAAYDARTDRAYVAVDDTLYLLDYAGAAPAELFRAEGRIAALASSEHGLLVLAAIGEEQSVLEILEHSGERRERVEMPMPPDAGPVARWLTADTVVVVGQGEVNAWTVHLPSGEVSSSSIYFFVYQALGSGMWEQSLYLPSAYPGEVVESRLAEDGSLAEVRRVMVNDWLHDVAMLDGSHALVAGHLEGVGVVELVEPDGPGSAPYQLISPMLWAYSMVGDGYAYSVANNAIACIDVATLTSHETLVPGLEERGFGNQTVPFGERVPGRVLLHQPGVGVVEFDCTAPATGTRAHE